MKRFKLSKGAWMMTAAALVATSVIPSGLVFADDGDDTTPAETPEYVVGVSYSPYGNYNYYSSSYGDTVTVVSGEAEKEDGKIIDIKEDTAVPYSFYTTVAPKAGKNGGADKIPAANKWVPISDGTVDLGTVKKATTLYFAPTSTPSLSDIIEVKVPAKKVLSQAKYVAKNDKAATAAMSTAQKSYDDAVEAYEEASEALRTAENDEDGTLAAAKKSAELKKDQAEYSWENAYASGMFTFKQKVGKTVSDVTVANYSKAISGLPSTSALQRLQKFGGSVGFSLTGSSVSLYKEGTEADSKTGLKAFVIAEDARPSEVKTVKIAKRAAGPAITVDYGNHVMKLKKNQSYGIVEELGGTPKEWTDLTDKKDVPATPGDTYAFRTAPTDTKAGSLITYVQFPEISSFGDDGSTAAVVGGLDGDANIAIVNSAASAKKVDYQYLLTDDISSIIAAVDKKVKQPKKAGDDETADEDGNLLDEAGDVVYEEVTKKVYEFQYGTDATSKGWSKLTKAANKTLATKTIGAKKVKNYILIREAAVGTNFSSKVMIFVKPTTTNKNGTWQVLAEADYDGTLAAAKDSVPALTIKQKSNSEYKYVVAGDADTTATNKDVTVSITKKVTGTVSGAKYSYTGSGAELTMAALTKKQTAPADSGKIDFTLPKGSAKVKVGGQDVEYPAYVVKDVTVSGDANKGGEIPALAIKSVTGTYVAGTQSSAAQKTHTYTLVISFNSEVTSIDGAALTLKGGSKTKDATTFEVDETDKTKVTTTVTGTGTAYDLGNSGLKVDVSGFKNAKGAMEDASDVDVTIE